MGTVTQNATQTNGQPAASAEERPAPAGPRADTMPQVSPTRDTWPKPRVTVEIIGGGGPQQQLPVGLNVRNDEDNPITLFGAMFDTDPNQQKFYFQGSRVDLSAGEAGRLPLAGWTRDACYLPSILARRTPRGLAQLTALATDPNRGGKSLQEVLGGGDIHLVYQSEQCVRP